MQTFASSPASGPSAEGRLTGAGSAAAVQRRARRTLDVQFLSSKPMLGYGTTELRCMQPAEYLREAGWTVGTGSIYEALPQPCRILVLHRVRLDRHASRVIRFARMGGARILYDTDDLTFENPGGEAARSTGAVAAEAASVGAAMRAADLVTVSTTFLRERVLAFHDACAIMRNGLSRSFLRVAASGPAAAASGRRRVTIGYFSGSSHHDADFVIVQPALLALMREMPEVDLVIGGKIGFSPEFRAFGPRFCYKPFRPYSDYIGLLGGIDINLVPLDTASDFANARSELKYIEAGAFGVPTVASPAAAYREAIADGRTGLLCADGGWFDALAGLVRDPGRRLALGAAARAHVLAAFGPAVRVREWSALVAPLISDAGGGRGSLTQTGLRTEIAARIWLRSSRRRMLSIWRSGQR